MDGGAKCSWNEDVTAIDKEPVINTEVTPGAPELFEIRGKVNFVVWGSSLNELKEVLVLLVIVGMVMKFLKMKVLLVFGSELSQLDALDRGQGAMDINVVLGHLFPRGWL